MSAERCVTLTLRKSGSFLFLGHRDVARALSRALRRSGLALEMTQGFHPHVRMVLPEPLPLGVGSDGERYVIHLAEDRPAETVAAALRPCLPEGFELLAVEAGAQRDSLDDPLVLELELEEELQELGPIASGDLGLARIEARKASGSWWVILEPPPGRRPSISKFLRAVEATGVRIRAVTRRLADSLPEQDCTGIESS